MKKRGGIKIIGRQETADTIGIDVKTLDRWVRDGEDGWETGTPP